MKSKNLTPECINKSLAAFWKFVKIFAYLRCHIHSIDPYIFNDTRIYSSRNAHILAVLPEFEKCLQNAWIILVIIYGSRMFARFPHECGPYLYTRIAEHDGDNKHAHIVLKLAFALMSSAYFQSNRQECCFDHLQRHQRGTGDGQRFYELYGSCCLAVGAHVNQRPNMQSNFSPRNRILTVSATHVLNIIESCYCNCSRKENIAMR